jgi:hypothetical protein
MTISSALIIYLLAVGLIPLTVSAYALSHVIMAKDFEPELQLGHRLMRRCMKAIPVYFSAITAALLLYLWLL